jgi:hypothetical protein
MASVMGIKSEVVGSCVGEIDVSVGMENRGVALLWVDLFGIYFGGESASRLVAEVGDGARYWRVFWAA